MKDLARILAAAAAIALLAGCSNKPPAISRVYARVLYQHDTATSADSEGLSVFLVASDPDGMENLSSFYVINDEAELFWKVDSTSWVTATAEGENWIGSNALVMPGSAAVPAGDYRVVLQNSGGDTVEQTFTIPDRSITADAAAYPTASVNNGEITVGGPYAAVEIWTYGQNGKFVASFPVTRKDFPLAGQKLAASSPTLAQGFTFRVFANDAKDGISVLSGPYTMPASPALSLPGR